MLNGFERRKDNGPESKKKELIDFAEAEGYRIENLHVDGNTIRFKIIDNEQDMVGLEAAELFCKQYNLLNRRSDDSQATVIEGEDGICVELDANRDTQFPDLNERRFEGKERMHLFAMLEGICEQLADEQHYDLEAAGIETGKSITFQLLYTERHPNKLTNGYPNLEDTTIFMNLALARILSLHPQVPWASGLSSHAENGGIFTFSADAKKLALPSERHV